jgi:hypothetical protein
MRAHLCRPWLLLLGGPLIAAGGAPVPQRCWRLGVAAGLILGGMTSCMPDVVPRKDVEIPKGIEEIDFADDGDDSLAAMNGRKGKWGTFRDQCPGGIIKPPVGTPLVPEDGGVNGSLGYYRGTAEGFHARQPDEMDAAGGCWGAFIYLDFNYDGAASPHDYDATAYTGIFFAAKGWTSNDNLVSVRLPQADLVSTTSDGACDPMTVCEDHYGDYITIEPGWRGYELRFSELTQSGWGFKTAFNPARLRSLQFVGNSANAAGISFDFDISIDQVGFIKPDP